MGGRIGRILSFLRVNKKDAKASDVKINQSGGNTVTCEHFEDAGSDSFPLNSDYPVITSPSWVILAPLILNSPFIPTLKLAF